jgi:hypothetical protein
MIFLKSHRSQGTMVGQATASQEKPICTFCIYDLIMSNKKPMVLIAPEVLEHIQNDVDKELEFKKVSLHITLLTLETP